MALWLLSPPFPQDKPGELSSGGSFAIRHFLHPKSEESILYTSHGGCIKRGIAMRQAVCLQITPLLRTSPCGCFRMAHPHPPPHSSYTLGTVLLKYLT